MSENKETLEKYLQAGRKGRKFEVKGPSLSVGEGIVPSLGTLSPPTSPSPLSSPHEHNQSQIHNSNAISGGNHEDGKKRKKKKKKKKKGGRDAQSSSPLPSPIETAVSDTVLVPVFPEGNNPPRKENIDVPSKDNEGSTDAPVSPQQPVVDETAEAKTVESRSPDEKAGMDLVPREVMDKEVGVWRRRLEDAEQRLRNAGRTTELATVQKNEAIALMEQKSYEAHQNSAAVNALQSQLEEQVKLSASMQQERGLMLQQILAWMDIIMTQQDIKEDSLPRLMNDDLNGFLEMCAGYVHAIAGEHGQLRQDVEVLSGRTEELKRELETLKLQCRREKDNGEAREQLVSHQSQILQQLADEKHEMREKLIYREDQLAELKDELSMSKDRYDKLCQSTGIGGSSGERPEEEAREGDDVAEKDMDEVSGAPMRVEELTAKDRRVEFLQRRVQEVEEEKEKLTANLRTNLLQVLDEKASLEGVIELQQKRITLLEQQFPQLMLMDVEGMVAPVSPSHSMAAGPSEYVPPPSGHAQGNASGTGWDPAASEEGRGMYKYRNDPDEEFDEYTYDENDFVLLRWMGLAGSSN